MGCSEKKILALPMKLEFLSNDSPDCPLVRIFEFTPPEIGLLSSLCQRLASGELKAVSLNELPDVEPVDDVQLSFQCADKDLGLLQPRKAAFELVLSVGGWRTVVDLMSPFDRPAWGYQWLWSQSGQPSLLLSPTGSW